MGIVIRPLRETELDEADRIFRLAFGTFLGLPDPLRFGGPGPAASAVFERLLDACETFAASRGVPQLVAGVNLGRERAARALAARGFRTEFQGIAMQRPNEPAFNRPDALVLDDWR